MLALAALALGLEPLDIPNDKCGVVVSANEDDRLVVFAMGQDQQASLSTRDLSRLHVHLL